MGLLWPVYEFRPLPSMLDCMGTATLRYADGKWVPDDGEYDVAFASGSLCLMVEVPYQRNILWGWRTKHWSAHEPMHPGGNAWHHHLREGTTKWGGDWGRDRHPNRLAGDAGMSFVCSQRGAAAGRHVEFHLNDPTIKAGLLRERESKKVVTFPDKPLCAYCGQEWVEQGEPIP